MRVTTQNEGPPPLRNGIRDNEERREQGAVERLLCVIGRHDYKDVDISTEHDVDSISQCSRCGKYD